MSGAAESGGWFGGQPPPSAGSGALAGENARAADRLATPSAATTGVGLPLRVPQAHLVPGAFRTDALPTGGAAPINRSPEEVRRRLDEYQRGWACRPDNPTGSETR